MIGRSLVSAIFMFLVVSSAAAQSREFDIRIASGSSSSTVSRSDPQLTVVITNRAPDLLDTGALPFLNFHVSQCFPGELCSDRSFYLFESMEARKLRENSEFRFFRDLSDTGRWKKGKYDTQETDFLTFSSLPRSAIHLWADIKIPDGFTTDAGSGKRLPKYREYRSNVLTLVP